MRLSIQLYFFLKIDCYFWLHWVFTAAQGLSLVVVHGLLIAVASFVEGHRFQSAQAQLVASCGLQSVSSVVVEHRLSCLAACGILPEQCLEPMFPAFAGIFLTTGPPGKSQSKVSQQNGEISKRKRHRQSLEKSQFADVLRLL